MEGDGEAPLVGWCRGNDVEEGRPGEGYGRRPSRAAGAYLRPIISEVPCLEQRLTALPLMRRHHESTLVDATRGKLDPMDADIKLDHLTDNPAHE